MKRYGLNETEVKRAREKYGDNRLTEQHKETFFHKLIQNFGDPMIRILCVALLLNLFFVLLHYFAGLGDTEWYETVGIAAAVIIATVVSTLSEYKNENAFQKLQQEASAIVCKVYRSGEIREVPIGDIVVGDQILLQSGDKIPADGIIVEGSIHVDQSALNGESKEALKIACDEYNGNNDEADFLDSYSVFRGAVVCSGNAVMQVTIVGDSSVYGKIAAELQLEEDRDSPLKHKLSALAKAISRFGYLGGAAVAVVYLVKTVFLCTGGVSAYFAQPDLWLRLMQDIVQAVMFAVIIIVMAVPEGLPLMIAIVSSMNMKKMLSDNVLVRKVSGIETAGSLNILFSDKTGTITKGKLETVLFMDGGGQAASSVNAIPEKQRELLTLSLRYNTTAIISGKDSHRQIIGGNPTERAVLAFVSDGTEASDTMQTLETIPFNSTQKFSAATVRQNRKIMTLIKGAPEKILKQCSRCYNENGDSVPLDTAALNHEIDLLAEKAIRVLAVAVADAPIENDRLPKEDWTLVGILGIRDELRPESVKAIHTVKQAGIQVVMITGDRKETAVAIAREAGLLTSENDRVLTSAELNEMPDDDVKALIPHLRVVARALPSDKSRLVRLSQELGLVVGMTGDGVNDSPALKKSDVGFAMGGGTEVAKEAGDIVILDDNFQSIAKAVLYGRTIFNNIRKFISFQLAINLSAVLISFVSPLLGIPNPLSITQILWVNLVMDTLAALAFGGEPALKRYMKEKPKCRDENIISKSMKNRLAFMTCWIFIISILLLSACLWENSPVWMWVRRTSAAYGSSAEQPVLMTVYFCFFIFAAIFNSLNVRSNKMNLLEHIGENKKYCLIMGTVALIQIMMTYLGGEVFQCQALNAQEWALVLLASVSVIPADLLRKAILRSLYKKHGIKDA